MHPNTMGLILLALILLSIGLAHLAFKAIYGPSERMREAVNRSIVRHLGMRGCRDPDRPRSAAVQATALRESKTPHGERT